MSSETPRVHQVWFLRDVVYRISDAASIAAGLGVALWLTGVTRSEQYAAAAAAAILIHYVVAEANGMYRSWRTASAEREILCTLSTWAFTLPALLCVGAVTGYLGHYPTSLLVTWGVAGAMLVTGARMAMRTLQRILWAQGYHTRRFAIVGVNRLGFELAKSIADAPELGLKMAGFYDDRPAERLPPVPAELGHHAGNLDQLLDATRRREIETIYIAFPMRAEARIKAILDRLSDTTASVYFVPDFFVFELLHCRWTSVNGLPALSIFENPFYGVDGLVKRGLDLLLAALVLGFLSLPMLGIALAVKLSSPGPVFFRQRRYGLDGREIRVWKFRTMRVCEDGAEVKQATQGDARVTRLGALLRRSSLDELPQLFNVLEGTMSLVGPRPHASAQNEAYRKLIHGYMLRHKVKPGITGLAQVNGWRGETDTLVKMERRVEFDHRYIREWSLTLDLRILLKTVWVVLSRQNAY